MLLLNFRRRNKNKYTHKLIYEGGITKETFDLMRYITYCVVYNFTDWR